MEAWGHWDSVVEECCRTSLLPVLAQCQPAWCSGQPSGTAARTSPRLRRALSSALHGYSSTARPVWDGLWPQPTVTTPAQLAPSETGSDLRPPWLLQHSSPRLRRALTSAHCDYSSTARPVWDGLWPQPSYSHPTLWQCRITSVPWEKPGLAPGSYSNLLCPIPSPGQDRNLYSTKEMITLLRTVAAASPNLAPHLNVAVTASTSQGKTWPMITFDLALPPNPLGIDRLHRDDPIQWHGFKTKMCMFSLISSNKVKRQQNMWQNKEQYKTLGKGKPNETVIHLIKGSKQKS